MYCIQCYVQESLVPFPGEETGKPVNMMRDELATKYNFDNVDELTIKERNTMLFKRLTILIPLHSKKLSNIH